MQRSTPRHRQKEFGAGQNERIEWPMPANDIGCDTSRAWPIQQKMSGNLERSAPARLDDGDACKWAVGEPTAVALASLHSSTEQAPIPRPNRFFDRSERPDAGLSDLYDSAPATYIGFVCRPFPCHSVCATNAQTSCFCVDIFYDFDMFDVFLGGVWAKDTGSRLLLWARSLEPPRCLQHKESSCPHTEGDIAHIEKQSVLSSLCPLVVHSLLYPGRREDGMWVAGFSKRTSHGTMRVMN